MQALVPRVALIEMNNSFRMFPNSTAAKGTKPGDKLPSRSCRQRRWRCSRRYAAFTFSPTAFMRKQRLSFKPGIYFFDNDGFRTACKRIQAYL